MVARKTKDETKVNIKEKDLDNLGVSKLLYNENQILKSENTSLKKSLKRTQDNLESLKNNFHKTDKENYVMKALLGINWLPESLKFLSSIGAGLFGGLFLSDRIVNHTFLIPSIICAVVYISLLIIFRNPIKKVTK